MFNSLMQYGFQERYGGLYWGAGSLVRGVEIYVKVAGRDLFVITIHEWNYDEWGERVKDATTTTTVRSAQVWSVLPAVVYRH